MNRLISRAIAVFTIVALLGDVSQASGWAPSFHNRPFRGSELSSLEMFRHNALAPQPISPLLAGPRARVMAWATNASDTIRWRTDPYRSRTPSNAFLFLLAKRLGVSGQAAVYIGVFNTSVEYVAGTYLAWHALDYINPETFSTFHGWTAGIAAVLISAFNLSVAYRLLEFHERNNRQLWILNTLKRKFWNRHIWIRFRAFVLYSTLAIPQLQRFHGLPFITLALLAGLYQGIAAIRVFRRELIPLPQDDEASRGVKMGLAIRRAPHEGRDLQIALLDMDDLAAYGSRLGFHGRDIINHLLVHLLWGPDGVIVKQFGTDIVQGNVGGDETYLCFQVPQGDSEEALEHTRLQLEQLRSSLKIRSESLFSEIRVWLEHYDPSQQPPPIFKDVPPERLDLWLPPLQAYFRENPVMPPFTLSGGIVSFGRIRASNPDAIKFAYNQPRQLFSLVRASLIETVNAAKLEKRNYAPGIQHILVVAQGKIPRIRMMEDLFDASYIAHLSPKERTFLEMRDPRKPFPNLSSIPVESQFRHFREWVEHLKAVHTKTPGKVIIGSIRHSYGGPALRETLKRMATDTEGLRSTSPTRGGVKAINTWDATFSSVDLIVTVEHMEFFKALNEELGKLPGFKPGQVTIAMHPHSPDTLFIAWTPGAEEIPNGHDLRFRAAFAAAMKEYIAALDHTIMVAKDDQKVIEVYPQVTLLETADPILELEKQSLLILQETFNASANDAGISYALHRLAIAFESAVQILVFNQVPEHIQSIYRQLQETLLERAQGVLFKRIEAEALSRMQQATPIHHHPLQQAA